MEHHIITTDGRELLWTNLDQDQDQGSSIIGGGGGPSEDMSGGLKKSRRSITEAERGLHAEPNALRPPTTKAGKQRIRMKWSNDVNKFIMRTYYQITCNETQTKSYRDNLHRLFAQQYPDVAISQQRIADQRRAIVKNNLLPKAVLDEIKQEVAQSLQMKSYSDQNTTVTTIIKQEHIPSTTTHIVTNHVTPIKATVLGHIHQQQQHQQSHHHQQPQHHIHHSQQQQLGTPIHIQTTGGVHQTTTRIHQASPTTAAALQNQPHIIIRVNATNPNGSLKHHFVDDGSGI